MASEDVIELGSSDEETEPAPKRPKNVKTVPNAMVHIPSKLPGVTIKPTTAKARNKSVKSYVGKPITVTKLNSSPVMKHTALTIKPLNSKPNKRPPNFLQKPIPIATNSLNPFNIMKKLSNVQINRVPKTYTPPIKHPVKIVKTTNIPPHVSIKRIPGQAVPNISNIKVINNKKKLKNTPKRKEVVTVELDDEEIPTTSSAGPAWYLRPEEGNSSMEQENNAEPEPTKMVEITIEDSPIKPAPNKRTHEIGAELAITIDDSPVKSVVKATSAESEDERSEKVISEPHSKKKLNYPEESKHLEGTTIEIELEPLFPVQGDEIMLNNDTAEKSVEVPITEDIIEVVESPAKKSKPSSSTPKKKVQEPVKSSEFPQPSQSGEFHPVYQEFIDLCLKFENSADMNIIVEKKIKSYYRQVPKQYSESEEFIDMVQSKIVAMKAGPDKLYLYIKDIVDELNLQRKMSKAQPPVKQAQVIEAENFQYGEDSEFDSKRQRQIRKLEKTLRKLHRAIQKLEEQEVDFDDDEDSVYLLTERYKERMVRVHAKFCQLTNTKMPSEPRIQIDPRPGQPAGPAKRLEKWVNKKVPIGKPLPFPDFHDVLRCVREANEDDKLGWNEADIMEEARDLFTRCGKKLQRRRQENEWRLAASRISLDTDPAETSEVLKNKLESNRQLGHKREADVFNKFADKQNQLKLEPVEIGDKEAEESPVESEDDDVTEEGNTLENKEERKKRLRRLIQEKSKKNEEKENEPKQASNNQSDELETKVEEEKDSGVKKKDIKVSDNNDKDNLNNTIDVKAPTEVLTETEKVHSISDNSNLDSDVDELHLLQKLHSDGVNSSTIESSDSDSPIDISDSVQSGSEKGKANSDVISIENSSYSESETKEDENSINKADGECTEANNQEDTKAGSSGDADSVLLASSDDENTMNQNTSSLKCRESVNLQDDAISIEETLVQCVDSTIKETAEIVTDEFHIQQSNENAAKNEVSDITLGSNTDTINTNTEVPAAATTTNTAINPEVTDTVENSEIQMDDRSEINKNERPTTPVGVKDVIKPQAEEIVTAKANNSLSNQLVDDLVSDDLSDTGKKIVQDRQNGKSEPVAARKTGELRMEIDEEPMEYEESTNNDINISKKSNNDVVSKDSNKETLDTMLEDLQFDLNMEATLPTSAAT